MGLVTLTIHNDIDQGTPEWHALRRGIVTASTVGKLLTTESPNAVVVDCPRCKATAGSPCLSLAKKTPTPITTWHPERAAEAAELPAEVVVADNETSRGLTATLVAERITGRVEPTFVSDDMFRGIEHEPYARERYAEVQGVDVEEVGFLVRSESDWTLGASPDGLVGDDGGIEVKCPRAKGHVLTILNDEVPTQYLAQVQACLLVSGRKWWDYVSFHAGLPLYIKRVHADPVWHSAIADACRAFQVTVTEMLADYEGVAPTLPATERIDLELAI